MSDPVYEIDLERTGPDLVVEGMHPFTIKGGTEGEGEAGPYWRFDCQCETPSEREKPTVALFLSLSQQSRWVVENFLDAVNAPINGSATINKFIGRRFRGQVEHGEYKGKPQAKITQVFPLSGGAPLKEEKPAKAAKAAKVAAPVKGKKGAAPVRKGKLPKDTSGNDSF
jgi:hypothetical protein